MDATSDRVRELSELVGVVLETGDSGSLPRIETILEEMADATAGELGAKASDSCERNAVFDELFAGIMEFNLLTVKSSCTLPDRVFQAVIRIMEHSALASGAIPLVAGLCSVWTSFGIEQRAWLLGWAKRTIAHGSDFELCFGAACLLSYQEDSRECLSALEQLSATTFGVGRRTLPYALLVVSKDAEDLALRKRALELLSPLRHDPDPLVAEEAKTLWAETEQ